MTNPPDPITFIEGLAQIKYLWWELIHELRPSKFTDSKRTTAWALAFEERANIVGTQQAWRDYNEEGAA